MPRARSTKTDESEVRAVSQAPGMREAVAFEEGMTEVTAVEACGNDAVWLAEIHFQKDRSVPGRCACSPSASCRGWCDPGYRLARPGA